jgi:alkaline phosphatase D
MVRAGTFLVASHLFNAFTFLIAAQAAPQLTHGPFVGHTTPTSASVWARCAEPGEYELVAHCVEDRTIHSAVTNATVANDHCIVWTLEDLLPNAEYTYDIRSRGDVIADAAGQRLRTAPEIDSATVTTLAFGSCAREDPGSVGVWKQMERDDPDAIVLLGDTPYIDSTDLNHQRTRYRDFAAVSEFARLLQGRSFYATWDDHDFGRNDTNGILPGKETSRRVFVEYHANPSYGDGHEGVYTKFRRGPVEVFLLDARYFAAAEPSPFDAHKPTLLGAKQWRWLQSELKASTAPFKILAAGMIWNGAVRPNKPDHWETYAHERQAVLEFIGRERISGVVLVGGDIHRTRVLKYETTNTAGYPLTELITSPIHDSVIEAANAPHPNLVFDAGMPHSFLLIEVDARQSPAALTARFKNSSGDEFYSVRLTESHLRAAK